MSSSKNKNIKGGWEILTEAPSDSFQIFSTKKSLRKNVRTGAEFEFFLIDGQDWANIIAITSDEQVVLVKQYRHGAEEYTLELPGGCIEPGEDPAVGVIRELEEETGYSTKGVDFLGRLRPNPAMMSNYCSFYLARDVKLVGPTRQDPGEDIEVVLKPLSEINNMIINGEISHAVQVAAFGLLMCKERAK